MPPPVRIGLVATLAAAFACSATAATRDWAAAQILTVTQAGVLGTSPAAFDPEGPLTQSALEQALQAVEAIQHPTAGGTQAGPPTLLSTAGPGSVLAGVAYVEIQAPDRLVDHVDFAVDGMGMESVHSEPYALKLDTSTLTDGPHRLAAHVVFVGGGYAIATWQVTVANADGVFQSTPSAPVSLPIAKSWLPGPAGPTPDAVPRNLFHATSPAKSVSIRKLDAALVAYLGLGGAAREIQATLQRAGLQPRANTGTEAVARLLGLRLNHPASQDDLELLPGQPATRAEAAYSLAQLLRLDQSAIAAAQQAADTFTLPTLTIWQQQILTTAVRYVGYPYVWGGTSPTAEKPAGVRAPGGFDCSGYVWRVYKLTPYDGEGTLADVLRGRTTYQMSGEVGRSQRIAVSDLQPADVMFFGARGPRSKPNEVDHAALYLGNGWFIQSSSSGVTLLPFAGWYAQRFAWGRRPLREAGLASY